MIRGASPDELTGAMWGQNKLHVLKFHATYIQIWFGLVRAKFGQFEALNNQMRRSRLTQHHTNKQLSSMDEMRLPVA